MDPEDATSAAGSNIANGSAETHETPAPSVGANQFLEEAQLDRDRQSPTHPYTPSLYLQSIAEAADRIARRPLLDLAGNLSVADAENNNGSTPLGQEHRVESLGQIGAVRGRTNSFATTDRPRRNELYSLEMDSSPTSGPLFYDHRGMLASPELNPLSLNPGDIPPTSHPQVVTSSPTRSQSSLPNQRRARELPGNGRDRSFGRVSGSTPSEQLSENRRNLDRMVREYRIARRAWQSHHNEISRSDRLARTESGTRSRSIRSQIMDSGHALIEQLAQDAGIVDDQRSANRSASIRRTEPLDASTTSATALPVTDILRAVPLPSRRQMEIGRSGNDITGAVQTTSRSRAGPFGSVPPYHSGQPRASRDIAALREIQRRILQMTPDSINNPAAHQSTSTNNERRGPAGSESHRIPASASASLRSGGEETASRIKAKNTMRYLSKLKHAEEDDICAIALARKLGIDSVKESLERCAVFDLPMRMDELPVPAFSSWLEPGVVWSGEQFSKVPQSRNRERLLYRQNVSRTNLDGNDALILSLRASRHRERIRAERATRQRLLDDRQTQNDLTSSADSPSGLASMPLMNSMEVLADMERHLSDLLEEEESRVNDHREWALPRSLLGLSERDVVVVKDNWPVTVTVHTVDWKSMTLTGTMSASHIPDRSKSDSSAVDSQQQNNGSNSIESFFDGEIIDFRNHEIETVSGKDGYTSGGLNTDVKYWAGLGPFREEVDRQKHILTNDKRSAKSGSTSESTWIDLSSDTPKLDFDGTINSRTDSAANASASIETQLDPDEEERAIDEAMVKCLGSRKWMEEKLGREWILMRWKERCFVPPTGAAMKSTSNASPHNAQSQDMSSSSRISRTRAGITSTSTYTPHDNASWGLTISGFYYVALHRQTGRIEGLYYDPGSQPYQQLRMAPRVYTSADISSSAGASTSNVGTKRSRSQSHYGFDDRDRRDAQIDGSGATTNADADIDVVMGEPVRFDANLLGIKRFFPSIEFR